MDRNRFSPEFIGLLAQNSTFISAFNVAQVCLTWYVFTYTGSAVAVGLVAIVETLAVLMVSLPVGTLVDRLNKGLLLGISGIAGFAVFIILSFNVLFLSFDLAIVLILSAVWGGSREITRSSGLSTLPEVAAVGSIARSNGLYRALSSSLGSVSNAMAGGLIVTLGIMSGFLFSAGAYLASAFFAFSTIFPFLRASRKPLIPGREGRITMLDEIREGFRWLIARKGFFLLTVSATFFNFFMDMVVTYYVVYVAVGLNAGSLLYGLMLSSMAAGDVSGSLIGGRVNLLKHSGKVNVILFGGIPGLCILALGLFPGSFTAIIFTFIFGLGFGISVNVWLTSAHNIVPPNMRGRYFAIDGVLSSISPVGIASGAATIALLGIKGDFIVSGVLLVIFTVIFALMKSLWSLDGRSTGNLDSSESV